MPDRIATAGFHRIAAEIYHADPAPTPSLSNSIAQILIEQSPLHAWQAHPRLNPNVEDEASRRMDLGSVAHALLLGEGKGLEIIDAPDYRTKVAQQARDAARAAGKLPVLACDHEDAVKMVAVARRAIAAEPTVAGLFEPKRGESELAALWQDGRTWCRALLDRTNMAVTLDYKTCPNAAPAAVARHLYANGYHVQDAWYRRGLDALDPVGRGRRKFIFLFQEIAAPFACSFAELDGTGRAMGERLVERALTIWTRCLDHDHWPAYPGGIHRAEMPGWMETSILSEEIRAHDHSKRAPADLLAAG